MKGTWTLTAPDGRKWEAETPLQCVSLEQKDRVPPEIAIERIFNAAYQTETNVENDKK